MLCDRLTQVTKLVENYRSHDAIITPYSKLFYHGELVASGDKALIQNMCSWQQLPNKHDFPVIFYGVRVSRETSDDLSRHPGE